MSSPVSESTDTPDRLEAQRAEANKCWKTYDRGLITLDELIMSLTEVSVATSPIPFTLKETS